MELKQILNQWLLIVFIIGTLSESSKSQDESEMKYDRIKDTLLIINEKLIDEYKVIMDRQELLKCDTLRVNQKGLWISSFKMSAITLGQDITLSSNLPIISNEMKNDIINGETKYKFIYLKDIILQSHDGRLMTPSTKSIKIIFSN